MKHLFAALQPAHPLPGALSRAPVVRPYPLPPTATRRHHGTLSGPAIRSLISGLRLSQLGDGDHPSGVTPAGGHPSSARHRVFSAATTGRGAGKPPEHWRQPDRRPGEGFRARAASASGPGQPMAPGGGICLRPRPRGAGRITEGPGAARVEEPDKGPAERQTLPNPPVSVQSRSLSGRFGAQVCDDHPDFFRARLDAMIDLRHPLAVLAQPACRGRDRIGAGAVLCPGPPGRPIEAWICSARPCRWRAQVPAGGPPAPADPADGRAAVPQARLRRER